MNKQSRDTRKEIVLKFILVTGRRGTLIFSRNFGK
ncbi:MAG: hypothetical protein ACD_61C00173G0001 [uncultured bacterium]|nr:MAG: hypothetical protein ACD_61C00173G0001 [uncultured bacterium]